jgi:hypothetical protein
MDPQEVVAVFNKPEIKARFPHGLSVTDYAKAADIAYNTARIRLDVCEALGLLTCVKIGSSKIFNIKWQKQSEKRTTSRTASSKTSK